MSANREALIGAIVILAVFLVCAIGPYLAH
jgi:uncharacterized membrane protein